METPGYIGPGRILAQVLGKYWYGEHVDYGKCCQNRECERYYAKQGHQDLVRVGGFLQAIVHDSKGERWSLLAHVG